jgi:hypothetical protein
MAPAGDDSTGRGFQPLHSRAATQEGTTIMTDQLIPGDLLHRAKVIGGLRQLADWLDAHPGVPVCPFGWDLSIYPQHEDDAARAAEVDRIAAILGVDVTDQTPKGGHYIASRTFGLITYEAVHIPRRRRDSCAALMSYSGCFDPADPGPAEVAP